MTAVARSFLGADIVTATPDGAPVTSMGGLKVTPDCAYGDLAPENFDAFLACGWSPTQFMEFRLDGALIALDVGVAGAPVGRFAD